MSDYLIPQSQCQQYLDFIYSFGLVTGKAVDISDEMERDKLLDSGDWSDTASRLSVFMTITSSPAVVVMPVRTQIPLAELVADRLWIMKWNAGMWESRCDRWGFLQQWCMWTLLAEVHNKTNRQKKSNILWLVVSCRKQAAKGKLRLKIFWLHVRDGLKQVCSLSDLGNWHRPHNHLQVWKWRKQKCCSYLTEYRFVGHLSLRNELSLAVSPLVEAGIESNFHKIFVWCVKKLQLRFRRTFGQTVKEIAQKTVLHLSLGSAILLTFDNFSTLSCFT